MEDSFQCGYCYKRGLFIKKRHLDPGGKQLLRFQDCYLYMKESDL